MPSVSSKVKDYSDKVKWLPLQSSLDNPQEKKKTTQKQTPRLKHKDRKRTSQVSFDLSY